MSGTIRVAAFQTAMLALLPAALTWLRENRPRVRVEAVEATQAEPDTSLPGLLTRDFDLVIHETFPGQARPARASEHHLLCEEAMRPATPADMLVHLRLVEQGHAVAFLPDLLWSDRTPGLVLDASAGHTRTVLATIRTGAGKHPLIRAVLTAIRHSLGELPARTG
ncbi:LysR substrate-binding domain-containing protein [Streptomyces sp. HMX87]|uniref:LysR substrate-binding domain-containing protein n=1 Tax=Streptomyces sp. HMX87 TaxID=3390849 RepID=UPI003A88B1DB